MSPDAVAALILIAVMVPFFVWSAWEFCIIGPSEEERSKAFHKENIRQQIYQELEKVELDSPEYWGLVEMLETVSAFNRLKPDQLKLLCPIPTRKGPNHAEAIARTTSTYY